jgi:hypothetical protein
MDKNFNLSVSQQDLVILRAAIEKLQITGRESPVVADIYIRINNLYAKMEKELSKVPAPPQ